MAGAPEPTGGPLPPVVVVLEAGPLAAELAAHLGEQRARALRRLLRERAESWAGGAFGDAAQTPADAAQRPVDAAPIPLGTAVGDALRAVGPGRIVVVLAPELATWPPTLGRDALDDLAAGCAISAGALDDGGYYLIAIDSDQLAEHDAGAIDWSGLRAISSLMRAAVAGGFEVGVLPVERGLRTSADRRARLVDPVTDGELRELLR